MVASSGNSERDGTGLCSGADANVRRPILIFRVQTSILHSLSGVERCVAHLILRSGGVRETESGGSVVIAQPVDAGLGPGEGPMARRDPAMSQHSVREAARRPALGAQAVGRCVGAVRERVAVTAAVSEPAFEFCGCWFRPVRLGLVAPEPMLGSPVRTPLNLRE
jgi:hypothetical protein